MPIFLAQNILHFTSSEMKMAKMGQFDVDCGFIGSQNYCYSTFQNWYQQVIFLHLEKKPPLASKTSRKCLFRSVLCGCVCRYFSNIFFNEFLSKLMKFFMHVLCTRWLHVPPSVRVLCFVYYCPFSQKIKGIFLMENSFLSSEYAYVWRLTF